MKRLIVIALLTICISRPVMAESPYEWIQEGDNTYCYVKGEYDEDHMLIGWHQIGGELYWFEDSDFSEDRPIGRMAKNEWIDLNDCSYHFDAYGHLDEWRQGLE